MATKKQKQELVDILKFTPMKVQLLIQGYGGESYAGRVDRKIYDHFKLNKYDLDEYAGDWDGEWNDRIPDDLQPFPPGSPYECEDLWHASGAELSDSNSITISDENGKDIWEYNLGLNDLEDVGVSVNETGSTDLDDLEDGTVIYWGGQGEKGCFFDAEFTLKQPFDPKKLTISYENCDGWWLITGVEYDGEELDGYGGYSTTGKWSENKWIIVGDEEVYESVSIEDRNEEIDESDHVPEQDLEEGLEELKQEYEELMKQELDQIWDDAKTDWFDISVNPERKGSYECEFESTTWPFPIERMCEWTGRTWKENGEKVTGIKRWRGLKFDPKEVA